MKKIGLSIMFIILFVLSFLAGQRYPLFRPIEPVKVKVDTLLVRDTIVSVEPVFVEKRVVESVLVPVTDTLRMRDTLFVYLDREQVVWQDSLSRVYASGINPQVDSVEHFVTDRYITIETQVPVKTRSRWGVGIQAGYGIGRGGLSPYVGAGVTYNILSW